MRFERKYEFNIQDSKVLEGLLFCGGFKEAFPERIVNSIYYDDDDFSLFRDAEYGVSERHKIRIRFYNNDQLGINIEKKNRRGEYNWKDYGEVKTNKGDLLVLNTKQINGIDKKIIIPSTLNIKYRPKIIVSYKRNYFVSFDGLLRATIDNNIKFLNISSKSNILEINRIRSLDHAILEIKYNSNYFPDSEILKSLVEKLNLILCRSSKYCKGISLLYNL